MCYGTRDSGLGTRDSGLGTRDSGLGVVVALAVAGVGQVRAAGAFVREGREKREGRSIDCFCSLRGLCALGGPDFFLPAALADMPGRTLMDGRPSSSWTRRQPRSGIRFDLDERRCALARIIHEPPAATADTLAVARATPSAALDVLSSTPSRIFSAHRAPQRRLVGLATDAHE